ncbi:hypothetical protein LX32DRAFT_643029 [Colletotrichum zoysiae]|uniref:Uncharacterized protein n=1 Tax=Colletotrichum zoysiae TaxID=1216348 RepID=A0AAD9HB46_9PEZI|nr:hypothetical protein LX32DRAFT_643029 [Colletotrichum zoysiae]
MEKNPVVDSAICFTLSGSLPLLGGVTLEFLPIIIHRSVAIFIAGLHQRPIQTLSVPIRSYAIATDPRCSHNDTNRCRQQHTIINTRHEHAVATQTSFASAHFK